MGGYAEFLATKAKRAPEIGRQCDASEVNPMLHICPLQLDLIARCIRLWSNPGETILTPFAGIGSEVVTAVRLGRRGVGIELKPSYWRTAVDNVQRVERELGQMGLFD